MKHGLEQVHGRQTAAIRSPSSCCLINVSVLELRVRSQCRRLTAATRRCAAPIASDYRQTTALLPELMLFAWLLAELTTVDAASARCVA